MRMRVDGILVVDKPEGITSLDVVREVKRRFSIKKAGHIGTLDPFATGVLPVVLNEATKVVPFVQEEPKEYEGILSLGEETTTDDVTGEVVSQNSWECITPESFRAVCQTFVGRIEQIPPMFSAVKINGKPLYHLARKGIVIERKVRVVHILDLQVGKIQLPDVHFRVLCSKGTYIRTLAKDMGRKAGCGAHLRQLRRVRSGSFTLDRAIPWDTLTTLSSFDGLQPWIMTPIEALQQLPEVIGDERMVEKLQFGREMIVGDLTSRSLPAFEKGQWVKITSLEEELVAILRSEIRGADICHMDPEVVALRPLRVFQKQPRQLKEGHA